MSYTGHCACGAVSATITGEPVAVRQCWCRQCQQIAAGGPTVNAMFLATDIALSGELGTHSFTAASGNTLTQHFCPKCGTPVFGQSSGRMHLKSLRLGFLDPGHGLAPEAAIWLDDKPEWATVQPGLECFPQGAPSPAPKA